MHGENVVKRIKHDLRVNPTLWGERQTTLLDWGLEESFADAEKVLEEVFSENPLRELEIHPALVVVENVIKSGIVPPDSTITPGIGYYKGEQEPTATVWFVGPPLELARTLAIYMAAARRERQESIIIKTAHSPPNIYLLEFPPVEGFGPRYTLVPM